LAVFVVPVFVVVELPMVWCDDDDDDDADGGDGDDDDEVGVVVVEDVGGDVGVLGVWLLS
jgi:hypothetical protein